nr:hypothetical protein Q903MT_gene3096 [Picea sitchensis]
MKSSSSPFLLLRYGLLVYMYKRRYADNIVGFFPLPLLLIMPRITGVKRGRRHTTQ